MSMKKELYPLFIFIIVLCSCGRKEPDPEIGAHNMLSSARMLMAQKNYLAAKDSILAMREKFPKAFNARTEGIIVLDSIELLQTQDSLAIIDSLLRTEKAYLNTMEKRTERGTNLEFYKQRTKVFYIEQHFDELCAKVKFYLRKIEIDEKGDKYEK